jgi:hypothetical protein
VADGVDDEGRLLVVAPGGDRLALGAGEVHLRVPKLSPGDPGGADDGR